jgi:hypothetical protein
MQPGTQNLVKQIIDFCQREPLFQQEILSTEWLVNKPLYFTNLPILRL